MKEFNAVGADPTVNLFARKKVKMEETEMEEMKKIMNYEEFREAIVKGIMDCLPDEFSDYKVKVLPVNKTNEVKEALLLIPSNTYTASVPNFYLDDAYDAYISGTGIDEILNNIASTAVMAKPFENHFSKEMIKKDGIILNLINRKKNEKLLTEVPYETYLDLAVVYRIIASSDNEGYYTILINNALMEEMRWTKKEVQDAAYKNTVKLHPLEVSKLSDRLYCMTNTSQIYGASMILYQETIKMLKEKIGGSFYMIPSSVHEMMIASVEKEDPEYLLEILNECNGLYVGKQEWLSDNLYIYDIEEDKASVYKKQL